MEFLHPENRSKSPHPPLLSSKHKPLSSTDETELPRKHPHENIFLNDNFLKHPFLWWEALMTCVCRGGTGKVFRLCARCCQKLRNGAIPDPVPTIIIGTVWSSGMWKEWALVNKENCVNGYVYPKLSEKRRHYFIWWSIHVNPLSKPHVSLGTYRHEWLRVIRFCFCLHCDWW